MTRTFVPALKSCGVMPVATELRDAVRFADVLPGPAVLVDGGDVEVAVRIPRLVLLDRSGDVDLLAGVEVRREAVVRVRGRRSEQGTLTMMASCENCGSGSHGLPP